jgi:hypothetical protein
MLLNACDVAAHCLFVAATGASTSTKAALAALLMVWFHAGCYTGKLSCHSRGGRSRGRGRWSGCCLKVVGECALSECG